MKSWIGAFFVFLIIFLAVPGYAEGAAGCDEPGTPYKEQAAAISPTTVRLYWTNTASESDIYFDIEGRSDPSITIGPYHGKYTRIVYDFKNLATNKEHCFRIWARVGRNGCRSKLPSAWACDTPTASSAEQQVPAFPPLPQGFGGPKPSPPPAGGNPLRCIHGSIACGGRCVVNDSQNCGACGNVCDPGSSCQHQQCVPDCARVDAACVSDNVAGTHCCQSSGSPELCVYGTCKSCIPHQGSCKAFGSQLCCDAKNGDQCVLDQSSGDTVCNIPDSNDPVIIKHKLHIRPSSSACVSGYVWREASPHDHVCVTPQTRAATREDNRRNERENCKLGHVWREAFPGDHVCVTPEARSQAAMDNRQAATGHGTRFTGEFWALWCSVCVVPA